MLKDHTFFHHVSVLEEVHEDVGVGDGFLGKVGVALLSCSPLKRPVSSNGYIKGKTYSDRNGGV
jgi:hypothetical protein